jgi:serine/threonine-protein kinase
MGAVYKARQPQLNRFVALKMLPSFLAEDAEFVTRFQREATAAANLSHPNLVQVYTAGVSDGTHYIAMELVDGESLKKRLIREGRIAPDEALAICRDVAEALKHGWDRSRIIHRDIKPDNVFLSKTGEVKLGDLGLAKTVGGEATELTDTGTTLGSPHYVSPEQATGAKDIDFHADIYSLGCTLYHLVTGKTPYEGDNSMVIITKHMVQPPPVILETWPQCPVPLAHLIEKMLQKKPHERHANYEELIAEIVAVREKTLSVPKLGLSRVAFGAAMPASQSQVVTVSMKPLTIKSPVVVYVAAGVAAIAVLGGAWWWLGGTDSQPDKTPVTRQAESVSRPAAK